jgi:hypothetical protein
MTQKYHQKMVQNGQDKKPLISDHEITAGESHSKLKANRS